MTMVDAEKQTSASYQILSQRDNGSQSTIYFRPADHSDLDAISQLEEISYPADEAASREKLDFRLRNAGNAFLVAVQGGEQDRIIGFTCGTCAHGTKLTHASMSSHEPDGELLCIHSVVVDPGLRRQGIATRMLKAYLMFVQGTTPQLKLVRLLCKQDLMKLYEGAGFQLLGPSDVVHGQDQWFEMAYDLDANDGQVQLTTE